MLMFEKRQSQVGSTTDELSARGYAPAVAAGCLADGRYSKAVEICREHLEADPALLSVRLVMARALYHAGQTESAQEQFYHILSIDPDNIVALKYLGDIKYAAGDVLGAIAGYQRVLVIDPDCRALCSPVSSRKRETTRTIAIKRPVESTEPASAKESLRQIYFYTETMGDLFLAQGHPRLAAEVYRSLGESRQNPRLEEKLARAELKVQDKETQNVKKTN